MAFLSNYSDATTGQYLTTTYSLTDEFWDSTTMRTASSTGNVTNFTPTPTSPVAVVPGGMTEEEKLWWYGSYLRLYEVAPPLVLTVGTVGNALIVAVLYGMASHTSTLPLVFSALAVSDLAFLYASLLPLWAKNYFGLALLDTSDSACKILTWLQRSLLFTSTWLLVAMTIQRALSVMVPLKMLKLCTKKRTWIAIAIIVSACLLFNSHLLYGYGLNFNQYGYGPFCTNDLDPSYLHFIVYYWQVVQLVFTCFLPFAIILISNGVIIYSRRISKRLHSEHGLSRNQSKRGKRELIHLSATLISISLVFIALTAPLYVNQVLYSFSWSALGRTPVNIRHIFLRALFQMLVYTNSAINIFLFVLTGKNFRARLVVILCRCWPKKKDRKFRSRSENSTDTSLYRSRKISTKTTNDSV